MYRKLEKETQDNYTLEHRIKTCWLKVKMKKCKHEKDENACNFVKNYISQYGNLLCNSKQRDGERLVKQAACRTIMDFLANEDNIPDESFFTGENTKKSKI